VTKDTCRDSMRHVSTLGLKNKIHKDHDGSSFAPLLLLQVRTVQVRTVQVRTVQVRTIQVRTVQVRTVHTLTHKAEQTRTTEHEKKTEESIYSKLMKQLVTSFKYECNVFFLLIKLVFI